MNRGPFVVDKFNASNYLIFPIKMYILGSSLKNMGKKKKEKKSKGATIVFVFRKN